MLCQKDPTNQSIRRQETTLILSTSPHNNNDKKLQTNYSLHLGDFIKGEIETMTKTTDKKNAKQKKMLNSANEAAACLVELANKDHHEKFSSLEEMQAYTREQVSKQEKRPANESSEDDNDNDE
jgi:hypothetical protein